MPPRYRAPLTVSPDPATAGWGSPSQCHGTAHSSGVPPVVLSPVWGHVGCGAQPLASLQGIRTPGGSPERGSPSGGGDPRPFPAPALACASPRATARGHHLGDARGLLPCVR